MPKPTGDCFECGGVLFPTCPHWQICGKMPTADQLADDAAVEQLRLDYRRLGSTTED